MELELSSRQTASGGHSQRMSRLGLLHEPMGYVDGASLYEFVSDDPAALVDPSGLDGQPPATQPTTKPTLAWTDFQGMPDPKDKEPAEDAFTNVDLATNYGKASVQSAKDACTGKWNATATYPNVTVTATFDKKGSWVIKGQETDSLLEHEVGHVVIAQNGAQRATENFRKLMGHGSGDSKPTAEAAAIKDLEEQIKVAFPIEQKKTQEQQMAYDDDTDHGRK